MCGTGSLTGKECLEACRKASHRNDCCTELTYIDGAGGTGYTTIAYAAHMSPTVTLYGVYPDPQPWPYDKDNESIWTTGTTITTSEDEDDEDNILAGEDDLRYLLDDLYKFTSGLTGPPRQIDIFNPGTDTPQQRARVLIRIILLALGEIDLEGNLV